MPFAWEEWDMDGTLKEGNKHTENSQGFRCLPTVEMDIVGIVFIFRLRVALRMTYGNEIER